MESVWWVFKQLFDKGLVYRGFKVRRVVVMHELPRERQRQGAMAMCSEEYIVLFSDTSCARASAR